jgi:TolB-like protein/tRNA A-37 threonylcarbamoyl transferase component Bud32
VDVLAQLTTELTDRYHIEREIGRGGMATVYLARDLKHDRRVALKVLRPELGAVLGVDRFLSEIRVTANLQHPNLLPLFDSGEAAGLLYYVMPFVEGETLRSRLTRETQLPIDEAIRIATLLAGALESAHRRGVIHRDLKPENILLRDGQPVIADFGIALAVSNAGGERVTQTGLSLGTPQYMSPEQATGDRTIDARSDIYSLSAVLYEMLTGEPPHSGPSAQAIIARLLTEDARPVSVMRPSVPPHVDAAIRRGLQRVPADRFTSAQEMVTALRATPAVGATGQPPAIAWGSVRRWRTFTITAAALVVVVAGVAALWRRGGAANASGTEDKSIAVLPLANLGGDTANAYFGEGLAEELQDALGKAGMRVIARAGARSLVAKGLDPVAIARQLGVRSVLDGSIQREGSHVRVTVHLISGKDGSQLWTNKYDKDAKDVFAMQDEIARSVVGELRVTLAGGPRAMVRTETADEEAHSLYLQGLYLWNRRSPATLHRAIDLFEQANRRDPGYARPLAGVAMAYAILPAYEEIPYDSAAARARSAAERALALDSTLAEAYAALGMAHATQWQNRDAERAFRHSIALDSSFAPGHQWYSHFLMHVGRASEGLAEIQHAKRLEPTSLTISALTANVLCQMRRCQEAVDTARAVLALDSTFGLSVNVVATVLANVGHLDESRALLETMVRRGFIRPSWGFSELAYVEARQGHARQARDALVRARRATGAGVLPALYAVTLDELGDHSQALDVLRQAVDGHATDILYQNHHPAWDRLRADPRADALLARTEQP